MRGVRGDGTVIRATFTVAALILAYLYVRFLLDLFLEIHRDPR